MKVLCYISFLNDENPFDKKKYVEVVKNCELEDDFENFPAGDKSEIGEKGINLSGS